MTLIVGLGNPGKKFEKARHNLGFRVIDALKNEMSDGDIVLLKPQTFMNNSGLAVKSVIKNLKLRIKNLFVIHDDIDIPLGKIRISKGRGAAGHKGVESIIKELKTKDFIRFRIGIKPKFSILNSKSLEEFVLQKFNKEEEKIIKEAVQKTIEAIKFSLAKGIEKAMAKYNQ